MARSYDVYVCLYVFDCPMFICQQHRTLLIVKIFGPGLDINLGRGNWLLSLFISKISLCIPLNTSYLLSTCCVHFFLGVFCLAIMTFWNSLDDCPVDYSIIHHSSHSTWEKVKMMMNKLYQQYNWYAPWLWSLLMLIIGRCVCK